MGDELQALRRENEALREKVAELEGELRSEDASFLRSVLSAVPAIISRLDQRGRIRFINRCLPGFQTDQVLGTSVYDYIDPDSVPAARACIERVIQTGETGSYCTLGAGAEGATRHYETIVSPTLDKDGQRGACLISFDITAHIERERALRSSEEALRVAVAATKMGLWRWDCVTNTLEWSESMHALTGYEGKVDVDTYLDEVVHPDDRKELRRVTAGLYDSEGPPWRVHRIVRPDGEVRWILPSGQLVRDEAGKPVAVVGGSLDVTEQRALEERLRSAQKLEALGSLTAGVAHNFNNMLAVILPFVDQAVHAPAHNDRELAVAALEATHRAADMVRQLMTVAGKRGVRKQKACDLSTVVGAAVDMCRRVFERQLSLESQLPAQPLVVSCNTGEIEQVIVNLCLNARDAVVDAGRAERRIQVGVSSEAGDGVPHFQGRKQSAYACVSVRDNGTGIDDATKERLFEPFFTTKGPERGTGLGLAMSYAVVAEHGGHIACTSVPGEGTVFTVYLPLQDGAPEVGARRSSLAVPAAGGGVRILLVDDDAQVRRTTGAMLRRGHHEVSEADSAEQACARLTEDGRFDVVLLDQTMPHASGASIVERIRRLCPRAKIICFTGDDISDEARQAVDAVIQKPVDRETLLARVGDTLDPR